MAKSFALLSELRPGDQLQADGGFTCLEEDEVVTVEEDNGELFVRCGCNHKHGPRVHRHWLDGQVDDGEVVVGFYKVEK